MPFGLPAVRKELAMAIGHPEKIVTTVEQCGEVNDLMVLVKELAAGRRVLAPASSQIASLVDISTSFQRAPVCTSLKW